MFSFSKTSGIKRALAESKKLYETAVKPQELTRNLHTIRMKVAVRCRAHIDQVFIEGAKKYEAYDLLSSQATARGTEKPARPMPAAYQQLTSGAGNIVSYLPDQYVSEIFLIGGLYQTMKISLPEAISQAQAIADKIWLDLEIAEPFEVVRFLRDQNESQDDSSDGSGDVDEEHTEP